MLPALLGLPHMSTTAWAMLVLAAALAGIAKTALPGAATIAVALCAAILPAKESTGAMLLMLMTGDLLAVWSYRRDADFNMLRRLVPAVGAGVAAGALFLRLASNDSTRRIIGLILLLLIAVTLVQRRPRPRRHGRGSGPGADGADGAPGPAARDSTGEASSGALAANAPRGAESPPRPPALADAPPAGSHTSVASSRSARLLYGGLAGFTTMVANAGGPVTSMYFLACRYPVKAFLGTTAWFFFAVNLIKLPFSIAIGLVNPTTIALAAVSAPVVVAAALIGRRLAEHMDQKVFEPIVVVLTVVSALPLLA